MSWEQKLLMYVMFSLQRQDWTRMIALDKRTFKMYDNLHINIFRVSLNFLEDAWFVLKFKQVLHCVNIFGNPQILPNQILDNNRYKHQKHERAI